jgi:hypothetical protein
MTPAGRSAPLALLAGILLLAAGAAGAQPTATVSLTPTEPTITFGRALPVSGIVTRAGAPLPGTPVELALDRYPYRGFVVVAGARTGADGRFSFVGLRPSRNSRLRVVVPAAAAASPTVAVAVDPAVTLRSRVLGRGRTRLSATAVHTRAYGSPPVNAFWYLARPRSRRFQLVAVTRTTEHQGVTTMQATVDPPTRRFSFVVCFVPRWARAMGTPSQRRPCRDHDFVAR